MTRAPIQQALDALETAKNGLEWYKDNHPEEVDGSDDEAAATIDAAFAALAYAAGAARDVDKIMALADAYAQASFRGMRWGSQDFAADREKARAALLAALEGNVGAKRRDAAGGTSA